jgi:hypothetical protein
MTDRSTPRFKRSRAARARRNKTDKFGAYILFFTIALGAIVVFGIAYTMTAFA